MTGTQSPLCGIVRRGGRAALVAALALLLPAAPAPAQSAQPASPIVYVNGRAVTEFQLDQRARFVSLLGRDGDVGRIAMRQLVDERLQLDAATEAGALPGPEEIRAGMEEFAARADMDAEQFIAAIGQEGVAAQTFRDFVRAGIAWRNLVQQRFGPRARVSEDEVERALSLSGGDSAARVRLAEIILPADTDERRGEAEALARQLARDISGQAEFAAAAREYSAAGSRSDGGVIEWVSLSDLPDPIAEMVLTLAPGETSEPVALPNAVGLFQLRGIRESDASTPEADAVEYARFRLAPDSDPAAQARRIRGRVDRCDDLYGVAKGLPEDRLVRRTVSVAELPATLARAIARLDPNEAELVTDEAGASLVMLCARTTLAAAEADRGAVRQRLFGQRLTSYAEGYLAELRAEALVREP